MTTKTQDKVGHTPGPWQCWQPGFSGGQWAFGPHGKLPIGKTLGDNAPVEEADARLIAAAPEMLEAMKRIAERVKYHAEDEAPFSLESIGTEARAAIAKATLG